MNGEPVARAAPAAPRPPAGLVRFGRARTRVAPHSGVAISGVFLAAAAGGLAVTVISAILVLMSPVPTGRQRAVQDGRQVLSYLWRDCGSRCTVQGVTQTTAGTWRVRLQTPRWRRCFLINPAEYVYVPDHGVTGLSAAACH